METVLIYGKRGCQPCSLAKALCDSKQLKWKFVDIEEKGIGAAELSEICGVPVRSVPQIFLNGHHIGGYPELSKLLEK